MRDINFYIEAAKRIGLSANECRVFEDAVSGILSAKLNLSRSALSFFLNGKSFPAASTFLRLAKLGNIAEEQALLDFAIIKNKDNPEVLAAWLKLQKKLIKS